MADTVINSGVGGGANPQGERIVGFWGRRGPLFRILLMNSLLGLLTFGIYRFWARTRLRQYFWNSIEIDGDLLEYTGRGLELFIGFLIVVAVLVPLLIGYQFISIFLQTNAPDIFIAVNFLYFIGIFWLTRYAYFRARRYRLARTVWRGIRGGQDGSAAGYAWLWFGYAVLSVITFGWAVPWMTVELQKYEVEHARFGVENFRYDGTGTALLRYWIPCGVVLSIVVVAAIVTTVVYWAELQLLFDSATNLGTDPSSIDEDVGKIFAWTYGLIITAYLILIPFYIYYRIAALRYMISASNLSEVGFVAEFSGWQLVGYWVLYFLVVIGLIAVVVLLVATFGVVAALSGVEEVADPGLAAVGIILSVIPIILLLFFLPMINLLLFYYPVIRHIATTLRLTDISSLERIVQSSRDDPRFGEGLAAALDVDVGGF
ncbi:MAG: DUF898 family protein [Alphaproteobacteria bacterium]|nr:DUF898 family protein [Alphaproteobacteria bacterium]